MTATFPVDDTLRPVLEPVLATLTTLSRAQRHLHPALLERIVAEVAKHAQPIKDTQDLLAGLDVAPPLHPYVDSINAALDFLATAIEAMADTPRSSQGLFDAYRALRYAPRAMEALYPLAKDSPIVSRFFLEDPNDEALVAKLHGAAQGGVEHIANDLGSKGGYSCYVPEYLHSGGTHPVMVALHGGSGHGRTFLWTWVKEARSRGVIVISPTSTGDTWALMTGDTDSSNVESMLQAVDNKWGIDRSRLLLTGMSDGGTFTYLSGLGGASPFTHLAPIAASFHPMMVELIKSPNIKNRPIYITHGVHDWMFEVDVARSAHQVFSSLNAAVVYREIADLAHTYPREENPHILSWFLDGVIPPDRDESTR